MTGQRPWFHSWFNSPYYHLLYDHRNEEEAKPFIDALLQRLTLPKKAKVLDLACGKGRHAAHLARRGLRVWGVDIAEKSIKTAQKQYPLPHLEFAVHDMRKPLPFPQAYFDAVFNLFTSFGYFQTEKEHLDSLKNVRRVLKPSAYFVLDFLHTEKVLRELKPEEVIEKHGIRFFIRRWTDEAGYINKTIRFTPPGQERELQFTERVRAYQKADFEKLFRQAGLRIEQIFGNYQLQAHQEETSERMILISRPD